MKKWSAGMLVGILLFLAGAVNPIPAKADSLYIVRIGLTEHLKQQSNVKISTKKIAIGYCLNNRFSEYIHFTSKSGFTFTPATGYYLVSDTVYPDYASVKNAYNKAQKIAAVKKYTYICMTGKNKWCLYVGGLKDVAKVSSWRDKLEKQLSTTFGSITSYNGHRVKITGENNTLLYDGADTGQYVQISANVLNSKGSKTLTVNGYEYRGRLEIGPYGTSKLTVVNITNVENYLRSVVGSEMNGSYPMEALKAQAIVSRTYAQNHCTNSGDTNTANPYSINDTETYQRYGGYKKETKKCVEAVTSTRGISIYSAGSQIDASFFPSSGGATEAAQNVWGMPKSYLKMVSDLGELTYGTKAWRVTYTAKELGELLGIGEVTNVTIDSQTSSGRVYQITVTGKEQSLTLKGDNVRSRLGVKSTKFKLVTKEQPQNQVSLLNAQSSSTVPSLKNCYALSQNGKVTSLNNSLSQYIVMGANNLSNYMKETTGTEGTYTFAGLGSGHGVGMSQAGARALADRGYSYTRIIQYYYGKKVTIK